MHQKEVQKHGKLKKILHEYSHSINNMDICPKCGLPKQACVCEQIVKSSQRIKVTTEKKRYGKVVTIISGLESGIDVRKTAKALKNELACGGTYRDSEIELQGDHKRRVKPVLVRLGFEENAIED